MFNKEIIIRLINDNHVVIQKASEVKDTFQYTHKIEDSEGEKLLKWLESGTEGISLNVVNRDNELDYKLVLNRSSIAYTVIN